MGERRTPEKSVGWKRKPIGHLVAMVMLLVLVISGVAGAAVSSASTNMIHYVRYHMTGVKGRLLVNGYPLVVMSDWSQDFSGTESVENWLSDIRNSITLQTTALASSRAEVSIEVLVVRQGQTPGDQSTVLSSLKRQPGEVKPGETLAFQPLGLPPSELLRKGRTIHMKPLYRKAAIGLVSSLHTAFVRKDGEKAKRLLRFQQEEVLRISRMALSREASVSAMIKELETHVSQLVSQAEVVELLNTQQVEFIPAMQNRLLVVRRKDGLSPIRYRKKGEGRFTDFWFGLGMIKNNLVIAR